MDAANQLRRLGDELRALAKEGMWYSSDEPYHRERYERVRRIAAELFALVDENDVNHIEKTVFEQLTHVAPVPVGDAAVIDDAGRILLIQRADDHLWAMPGGGFHLGETPAQGVVREAFEETGVVVEVTDLVGVYDSRYCETQAALQLFMFVFLCRPVSVGAATTPQEVLGQGWFRSDELPDLSPGHTVRVPHVFEFLEHRLPFFDRGNSG